MGRRFPCEYNTSFLGPFLCFPFSIIGFATSIVVITALCTVRFRRKSSSQPTTMSDSDSDSCEGKKYLNTPTSPSGTVEASQEQKHPRTPEATVLEINTTETENKSDIKELPLPPALQHPNIVDSKVIKRATSERKLSYNVSKKMPRSVSVPRNWDHKENGGRKKMKLKTKESVWMKTIILGGKCVPDEEENAVIYERKGKKISAYHPRQSTSMSLSRQWSQIASSALSVPQSHEERVQSNPV